MNHSLHRILSLAAAALSVAAIFAPAGGNGGTGISAPSGIVAFCKAAGNNTNHIGSADISATGATRTGNNPTP